jgi:hypothetical protein
VYTYTTADGIVFESDVARFVSRVPTKQGVVIFFSDGSTYDLATHTLHRTEKKEGYINIHHLKDGRRTRRP